MTITFRSASSSTQDNTTDSGFVGKPSGTVAGDLLIAFLATSSNGAITPPAGWTQVGTGTASIWWRGGVWWKIAGASEPTTYKWTAGGSRDWASAIVCYSGTAQTNPIAAYALQETETGSATVTAPGLTAPSGSLVVAAFGACADGGQTSGYVSVGASAGTTSRVAVENVNFIITALRLADFAASGATTAKTATATSPWKNAGWQLAIAPPNQTPNAPTLTSMAASDTVDRANVNRASHTFSDPDAGDSQSAFDHRYRLVGAATWTTAYVATPNLFVDYPAGTFAAGNYERQVRSYDALGVVGPWSASGYFTAADAPATPTITAPTNGATISAQATTVTWSAPAQDAYQLQVLDGGTVVTDTGTVVSLSRAHTVDLATNNVTRTIRVRVRSGGLWSAWYGVTVTVSYTPPPTPVVAVTASPGAAALLVTVTNPAPAGGQPAVTHNRVYVDDGLADGETLRVDQLVANGTWTYWTPRSGRDYSSAIRVVAVGANGTETTS